MVTLQAEVDLNAMKYLYKLLLIMNYFIVINCSQIYFDRPVARILSSF